MGPNVLQRPLKTKASPFTRYRFTATLILLLLQGRYRGPHRTINRYVEAFTGFQPTDRKDSTDPEPQLLPGFRVQISKLKFSKMSKSSHLSISESLKFFIVNRDVAGEHALRHDS